MWGGCGGRGVPKGSRGPVSVCPVCPSPSVSSHRVCPSHLSVCPALCPPIHPSSSALTRSSFIHLSVSPPPPVCPSIHPSVPIHPFVHPSFATPLCPHWCLSPAAHSCCFVTIHIRPFLSVCPVCPSIPMSIYVHLSIHPSIRPFPSTHPVSNHPHLSVCPPSGRQSLPSLQVSPWAGGPFVAQPPQLGSPVCSILDHGHTSALRPPPLSRPSVCPSPAWIRLSAAHPIKRCPPNPALLPQAGGDEGGKRPPPAP